MATAHGLPLATLLRCYDPDGELCKALPDGDAARNHLPHDLRTCIDALSLAPRDVLLAYLNEPPSTPHNDTLWHALHAAAPALRYLQLSYDGPFAACPDCSRDIAEDDDVATAVRAVVTPKEDLAWLLPRARGRGARAALRRALYDPSLVSESAYAHFDVLCVDWTSAGVWVNGHPRLRPARRSRVPWLTVPITRELITRVCGDSDALPTVHTGMWDWMPFMNGAAPRPMLSHPLLAALSAELTDDAQYAPWVRRLLQHTHPTRELDVLTRLTDPSSLQPHDLRALCIRLERGAYPSELGAALSLVRHAALHSEQVAAYAVVWKEPLESAVSLVRWLHSGLPHAVRPLLVLGAALYGSQEMWEVVAPRPLPAELLLPLLAGARGAGNSWQLHALRVALGVSLYKRVALLLQLQAPRPCLTAALSSLEYMRVGLSAVLVPASPGALQLPPELAVQLAERGHARQLLEHAAQREPYTAFGSRTEGFTYPPWVLDVIVRRAGPQRAAEQALLHFAPAVAEAAQRATPLHYALAFRAGVRKLLGGRTSCIAVPWLWPRLCGDGSAAARFVPRGMDAGALLTVVQDASRALPSRSLEWCVWAQFIGVAVRGAAGCMAPLPLADVQELAASTRFHAVREYLRWFGAGAVFGPCVEDADQVSLTNRAPPPSTHPVQRE